MPNMLLFVISSLFASLVMIEQFVAEYWFALAVLAVHPVVMFNWTLWFLRTLRALKS